MAENENTDSRSADYKWVWEIHKNCDQLLHQRLAAFTAAQAMTLAAFTLLTIARFKIDEDMVQRIPFLESSRFLVALFGLLVAVCGWLVTYPMYYRIQHLNQHLATDSIYKEYLDVVDKDVKVPFIRIDFPLKLYREVIPIWLPVFELGLWIGLIVLTILAALKTA